LLSVLDRSRMTSERHSEPCGKAVGSALQPRGGRLARAVPEGIVMA
jgi:hypothetical protein